MIMTIAESNAGWGANQHGQLCLGDYGNRGDSAGEMGENLPTVPLGFNLAVKVACGVAHTCALLDSGEIKCGSRPLRGVPPSVRHRAVLLTLSR